MAKYLESFECEGYTFDITNDGDTYWAKCGSMSIHDDDIESLKRNIPICIYQNKKFRIKTE